MDTRLIWWSRRVRKFQNSETAVNRCYKNTDVRLVSHDVNPSSRCSCCYGRGCYWARRHKSVATTSKLTPSTSSGKDAGDGCWRKKDDALIFTTPGGGGADGLKTANVRLRIISMRSVWCQLKRRLPDAHQDTSAMSTRAAICSNKKSPVVSVWSWHSSKSWRCPN